METIPGATRKTSTDVRPQPRPEIIERRFTRLKSNMQGGPDQILHMDGLSIEQKWRIINDEPSLKSSLHDVKYYKTQLEGHIDPAIHQEATMKKSSWKKMVKTLAPVKEVIEDLKEDLHSAKTDFLKAFISDKVGGVILLAKFLSQTQTLIEKDRSQQNANNSASIQPPSRTSTLDKKQLKLLENIKRTTMEESDAMNCLRKISEDKEGLSIIIQGDDVLEIITSCVISRSLSARLYAFMVLIAVCESRDGLNRVLTALSAFRKKLNEKVRFHAITQMMFLEKSRVELVTICLRFINTMLSSTTDMNKRVYLQYELEMAEFNPIKLERLYRLEGELPASIKLELDAWHSRYVSIQRLQENLTTIETRNALLRKEVDRQGSRMTDYEAENKALQTKILDLVARSDDYRDRVNELQDTIEKLTREYTKKTGQHAEKQFRNFNNLMKPLEPEQEGDEVTVIIEPQKTGERKLERKTSVIGEKKKEIVISKPAASKKAKAPPPPTPPPAPPDLPPSKIPGAPGVPLPPPLIGTVRKNRNRLMSKHALPMLNWNTITTPGNTIFKVLDDENVYDEMDFEDFENHFRLKETSATTATMEKLRRLQEKQAQKIRMVDNNRAKNLIITQRRIALSPKDIRGFVDRCDITGVPGEYAELLLNFVPTKDELKKLAENADKYEDMGEAEQFMFQMARVDRYESKLRLMTFMGIYSDLVVTLKPEIEAIVKACDSIVTSGRLKKLLEIVLAFGNYMNSSKRGPAIGFKLESLQRLTFVKSSDRSHNFLHYLVEAVNRCYPEIKNWYNDLQFDDLKSGSLEALTMDIQGLRKGLELAKFERERQMDNPIIGQFYVGAADTIHALSEGFKKMEEIYHYTTKMFGENGDHVEPINFFKLFKDFSGQYQAAERANSKNPIEVAPKRKPAKKKGSYNQQYGLPTQELPSAGITGRLGLFRRSTQNKGSYEVKSKATPSTATIPDESVTNLRRDSPSSSDSGIASMASSGDSGSARSIPYVSVDGNDSSKTGGVVMTANGHGNAQTAGGEGGGGDKAADGNSNFWGMFSSLK